MGIRGTRTSDLIFEDLRVPKENLLGELNQGFKVMMKTLEAGRIGVAAQAVGVAQSALDEAIKYTKARVQFGKPLSKFQNTQFTVADMATKIQAARLLVHHAAQVKDNGGSLLLNPPWPSITQLKQLTKLHIRHFSFTAVMDM